MPRYSKKNRTNRKDDYKYEKYDYKKGGKSRGRKKRVKRTMW